jgi:microcystin degradation protein MlrC
MRLLLFRLFHETNTFAPGLTPASAFTKRYGTDVFSKAASGSMVDAIHSRANVAGIRLVPLFDVFATPGPLVDEEVVSEVLECLRCGIPIANTEGIDGVIAILHGAMVSEREDDVEGRVLEQVATLLDGSNVPVVAILDLHANVSQRMARHSDALVAYRCNPHTDAVETGLLAFDFLVNAIVDGKRYETRLARVPILLPPMGTDSSEEPMAGLLAIARRHESVSLPIISVCPGFAHADTRDTGLSFQFVLERGKEAGALAAEEELSVYARTHAVLGFPKEWDLDEAIKDALRCDTFPVLLVEPSDNIGGGSSGDATWVLDACLRHHLEGTGIILAAREIVEQLWHCPIGSKVEIVLGGRIPELTGPPVRINAQVVRHFDGVFEVEDKKSHFVSARGSRIEMGLSVVVESAGIILLLTSRPTAPMDLGQWRCAGLDPECFRFIGIKAAVAHRRAYDPIARSSYTVATPGSGTNQLETLTYRKIRRPVFPLDA